MPATGLTRGRPPQRGLRALVVDADPDARAIYRGVLKGCGLVVHDAASGVAAITAARDEPPDLLILDTQLPDVEGRQVVEWVRSLPDAKATPAILLGWDPRQVPAAPDAACITLALTKPVVPRALRQAVQQVLSARS